MNNVNCRIAIFVDRDWIGVSKNEAAKKMQASGENILVQKRVES